MGRFKAKKQMEVKIYFTKRVQTLHTTINQPSTTFTALTTFYNKSKKVSIHMNHVTFFSISCSVFLSFSSYILVTTMDFQLLLSAPSSLGPLACSI